MTRKGVWDLQDVRDKYLQSLWLQYYEMYVWGEQTRGSLGLNSNSNQDSPVQLPGTNWSVLCQQRCNDDNETVHYFAIKDDNTLWGWGGNSNGILGQNSTQDISSPVQIPGTTWAYATTGAYATYGVKTDGTLWSWGITSKGAVGLNQTANNVRYSSPVQIPGTTWSTNPDHAAAGLHACHWMKTDGTLWAWGANETGGLGQNNKTYYSSPVQIPGTTWKYLGGVRNCMNAIKTDGTMWGWGSAGLALGLNSQTEYSSPKQIPGTTWDSCVCSSSNGLGHKTDGTLWVWGNNNSGRLGLSETDNRMVRSPEQIGSDTTWSTKFALKNTGKCNFAIKTDGTMWAWGFNSNRELGFYGPKPQFSSPVQIGAQSSSTLNNYYTDVSCAGYHGAKAMQSALTPSQL